MVCREVNLYSVIYAVILIIFSVCICLTLICGIPCYALERESIIEYNHFCSHLPVVVWARRIFVIEVLPLYIIIQFKRVCGTVHIVRNSAVCRIRCTYSRAKVTKVNFREYTRILRTIWCLHKILVFLLRLLSGWPWYVCNNFRLQMRDSSIERQIVGRSPNLWHDAVHLAWTNFYILLHMTWNHLKNAEMIQIVWCAGIFVNIYTWRTEQPWRTCAPITLVWVFFREYTAPDEDEMCGWEHIIHAEQWTHRLILILSFSLQFKGCRHACGFYNYMSWIKLYP